MSDPTNTEMIRQRFIKEVRRRFRRVRGAVREAVGYENDVLHLQKGARLADADEVERFATDEGKARAFKAWLAKKLQEEVLEPVSRREVRNGEHWTAKHIRAAAGRAWENATSRLQQQGVDIADSDLEDVFRAGVPKRQLRRLYTRTYENLESVTSEAAPQVRDVLTRGLAEGWNPRKMADELTDEVRTIENTRAAVLARTETIHSYTEMSLTRYEEAGVGEVSVSGEFRTAEDEDVCPICSALNGRVFGTEEMRNETFEFDPSTDPDAVPSEGGVFPVKPPIHPRCRCAVYPHIS
jgi:SPP1 gp7 family putative phage head morphogenesis protein